LPNVTDEPSRGRGIGSSDWFGSGVFEDIFSQSISDIARIQRRCWLEKHDFHLFGRIWLVLDATRNYKELAGADRYDAITKTHVQRAAMNEKKFILRVVLVPNEFTFELHALNELTIQLRSNVRIPIGVDSREHFKKICSMHVSVFAER
jgi:hypothetical protein